jgi:hypothetical protein
MWYSILALIAQTEILSCKQISDMGWNGCDVNIDEKTSIAIAKSLNRMIEDKLANKIFKTTGTHCESSILLAALQGNSLYQVDSGVIREFIDFCNHSGGFEVC